MVSQPSWHGLRRTSILDQQLWFLGRDISCRHGNALRTYGFDRWRPPTGEGSSAYWLPLRTASGTKTPHDVLICWGFGVYAGAPPAVATPTPPDVDGARNPMTFSGVFIERFANAPTLVRDPLPATLHQVSAMPRRCVAATEIEREFVSCTVRAMARALAGYERWAITTLGVSHHLVALKAVPRHKLHRFAQVPELSGAWERLAGTPVSARSAGTSPRSGRTARRDRSPAARGRVASR